MVLGIVGFVVALLVSVLLHEAGHMLTAKAFGMKVTQYFAGFGPTLWSVRRGETEYGVKAIPAGGFVRITGQVSLDDVAPEDTARAMVRKPGWQRFVVLVAGSLTHFAIAIALFAFIFAAYPSPDGSASIVDVPKCLTNSVSAGCTPGAPAAPAAGKLQPGDVVVAVNGHSLSTGGTQLSKTLADGGTAPVTLTVRRDGALRSVVVTPKIYAGKPRIGVVLDDHLAQKGIPAAIGAAFTTFGEGVAQTGRVLAQIPHEIGQVFTVKHRSFDNSSGSVVSVVGAGRLSGEALAHGGFGALLGIIAAFNLSIGLFNLLPLLPLDGGHIAVLAYERARAMLARLRRRPEPGLVDYNRLMPVTLGLTTLLIVFGVVALLGDIVNPVQSPF